MMTNCRICNQTVSGNFCSNCGQAVKLKRIDRHYISHEILHLVHFEKGFFYTVKELVIRPGESIREFITENRSRLMKPVAFLVITSLIYTVLAHFFHLDEIGDEKSPFGQSSVGTIMEWIQSHYGYANLVMSIFIVMWTMLFFRKYGYNFFEISMLICFVMGEGMLLLSLDVIIAGSISKGIFNAILYVIFLVYPTFAIGQFFDKSKAINYVKALLAYLLGFISFEIVVIVVGLMYDSIVK